MKLSDLFITRRQVFGFFVPGSTALVATVLLISPLTIDVLLQKAANAPVRFWLLFVFVGFLLGILMQFLFRNLGLCLCKFWCAHCCPLDRVSIIRFLGSLSAETYKEQQAGLERKSQQIFDRIGDAHPESGLSADVKLN